MYSSIHSLAHRAPVSRTRARWQPYGSLPPNSASLSSTNTRSPSSICANSPTSSAPSSPVSAPQYEAEAPKQLQQLQPTPQQQQQQPVPRDAQTRDKNKYALSLVDQAVKSLCEIWRPQDIPKVFLTTSSRTTIPVAGSDLLHSHHNRNSPLPSPSIQTPPPSLFATGLLADCDPLVGSSNLVPMKGFVHEVLRRSRTSGSVLQTALCYLEAIRPRISELIQLGEAYEGETELAERITVATEAELAQEAEFNIGTDTILVHESDDSMDTVRVSDSYSYSGSTAVGSGIIEDGQSTLKKAKGPSPVLPTLPPLPSPLLCPRRAFLASLILASKFTQDKCYSNRAWAKLSGLPAREIGRCERALGDALDWRLWVGKSSPQGTASPSASTGKPLARCRSESSLPSSPTESPGFLSGTDKRSHIQTPPAVSPPSSRTGLRRATTLPAEAFAFGDSQLNTSRDHAVAQWVHSGNDSLSKHSHPDDQSFDMVMYSPDTKPVSVSSANVDVYISDSSPSTPGLSYSPTSTESSSGDRTIQMPFFDDKNMSIPDGFNSTATLLGISSDAWPCLDLSPSGPVTVASMGNIGNIQDFTFTHMAQRKPPHGIVRDAFGNANVWSPDLLPSISRVDSNVLERAILVGSGSRM
ncbi:hypothetical protein BT96DRAFT_983016 [Gymnopus androsaceus JB14]|uniref:Cyclin N-terminal domain-containing protein n=1 Tax=Gymnopus androsaceus JB14 TaxID=1447944 RepID=A0A6A4IUQ3_9AGAR|nr:hypothetical protein BT96DRAFT_983016 [Gymnopus androsaceus JB14]